MTDWVANYEISDVSQILGVAQSNIYFFRYNSFEFPELVKEVKHEEKKRLKEEEPFKGKRFIMESFSNNRKLETVENFMIKNHPKELSKFDRPMVFICDLKGHYLTCLAFRLIRDDGTHEDTLLMINSTSTNYINRQEVLFTLAQIAFPEGM